MKTVYIIYKCVIIFPFFMLHLRDRLIVKNLKEEMKKSKNVTDPQLEKLSIHVAKVRTGKVAIWFIIILNLIDVLILVIGGYFR